MKDSVIGNVTVGGLIEALTNLDQDAPIVLWEADRCSCHEPGCAEVGVRPGIVYLEPGDPLLRHGNRDQRLYILCYHSQRNECGEPNPQPAVEPYR